jgi:leucyl aminopeptidase (aminopeptidase T)
MTDPGALRASAEAAVACLGIASDEAVIVVYNHPQERIARALAEAAKPLASSVMALRFPPTSQHGVEPPANVARAMLDADVVFAPTSRSLTHTPARRAATERGARIATMPTITDEIFARAIAVDYVEVQRRSASLADLLTHAATARVTSAAGTDIVLSLAGRRGRCDDGDLRSPGAWGNLPAGEAFIAPVETVGDGVIVFDGSLAGHGRLTSPATITVRHGRAIEADTKVGDWLLATLDAGGEHGRSLAELGIGTNPAATVTGEVLEDEKAAGTIHLAFGTSAGLGGVNNAGVHIDGIILQPTVQLDGKLVIEDGRTLGIADRSG